MNIPPEHFYIIDDDQSFGKSLRRLLNARGFPADYFRSARFFLDSVPSGQHGWAIVDIHMSECNGFALIDKMHDLHYDMPVIVITGQAQADARDLAMQKGAVGFLQKPFSEESLLELINNAREEG
jgi:two-component system, LuxR family, response regulator FixJ